VDLRLAVVAMAVMVTGVIAMAVMATAVLLDHHWGI
jgi:hypothetical protein